MYRLGSRSYPATKRKRLYNRRHSAWRQGVVCVSRQNDLHWLEPVCRRRHRLFYSIVESAKLRKCEHENTMKENWGEEGNCLPFFPPLAPFSQIKRLYFSVLLTYASSLLSESLGQATDDNGALSCFIMKG